MKTVIMEPVTAPAAGTDAFYRVTECALQIPQGATGYDVTPWTDTTIFSSVAEY